MKEPRKSFLLPGTERSYERGPGQVLNGVLRDTVKSLGLERGNGLLFPEAQWISFPDSHPAEHNLKC